METLQLFIPGMPRPKARPRFRMLKGRPVTYTPKETADYEQFIAEQVRGARTSVDSYLGPVQLMIGFYMPCPATVLKRFVYHRADCDRGPNSLQDDLMIGPTVLLSELWKPCKRCKPGSVAHRVPVLPTVRPDLDNLEKAVSDGIQKSGIIRDDCQVVEKQTWKEYASEPGIHIHLTFGVRIGAS